MRLDFGNRADEDGGNSSQVRVWWSLPKSGWQVIGHKTKMWCGASKKHEGGGGALTMERSAEE